ncbi:hypothetical protein GCM10011514_03160 [Emticicia aquatilis]|uniref:Peptidase S74 domain-containing protein n=1 Tax=Emticicia aquatilis TaxID=1537369 RepID=A0A916YFH5_9BACT|nr:tail fiber domain-containing protein [Emticicia aquatilis]GGD42555.1 hypothetical protein GCM10011514_03160 [Emticicia aquatilis]
MKNAFILIVISSASLFGQSITISPNNGSKLIEATSTNKAVQMPSVLATTAITSPQKGMVVFDDATGNLSYFNGSIWIALSNSTTGWAVNGTNLSNTNSGNVGIGTNTPLTSLQIFKANNPSLLFSNAGTGTTINDGLFIGNTSSGKGFLWNYENATIGIGTDNNERITVLGNGNIGIGDETPTQKLDVAGTVLAQSIGINATSAAPNTNAMLDISSTTKGMLIPRMTTAQRNAIAATAGLVVYDTTLKGFWFNDGTTWQPMNPSWDTDESKTYTHAFNNATVLGIGAVPLPTVGSTGGNVANGRLQITGLVNSDQLSLLHPNSTVLKWGFYTSYTDSSLNFYYNGSLRANIDRVTGVYTNLSDRNFKKNIIGLNPVLDNVLKLNAYKYNYLKSEDSDRKSIGFMAQDVLPYFPELVYQRKDRETKEPFLMMDYAGFGIIAIKAIQEQQAIINNLQAQIDELKKLIVK